MRDSTLDKLKGFAILLVVAGHTLQAQDSNYDNNFYFRLIYAFHMPFFVLLSGASASFWIADLTRDDDLRANLRKLAMRIRSSANYLLIPFITWTLINYLLNPISEGLLNYFNSVLQRVDLSLWFLPVIFWCTTFLAIGLVAIHEIQKRMVRNSKINTILSRLDFRLFVIFVIWLLVRTKSLSFLGIGMVNYFHGGLFFYFLIGVYLHSNRTKFQQARYSLSCLLLFGLLVPFWSRIEPNNFTQNVPAGLNSFFIGAFFTVIVASTGSCAFYLLGRSYFDGSQAKSMQIFSILGSYSLGIYAIHTRFLLVKPYLLAPAVISLILAIILNQIPLVRTLLLGKKIHT